jgi:hypothetical protein
MSRHPDAPHVRQSVDAATEALSQLARSLRAGGFAEGAGAYQRMAQVLVAQRIFHAAEDPDLAARFDRLGETARSVFELLEPYTTAMRRLAALAPEPEPVDTVSAAAVLDQLGRRGRRGMSTSLLIRATKLPRDQVEAAVARLVQDERVVARDAGGTTTYRLANPPGIQERART